ncbi:hypothetical protein [Epibacterium ulvae]|uniref:TolB amino-terminal domain-containing protein n=1 Tax=Epibacterium ulvae TaxID=1156985 RepID=A0A1G5PNJ3_9RHOB|nr:hypothetical protein [Epibacterium ulvae]SCZ51145.1 hypothetical protein SAMN04488118_101428 [Epibacterium ulvae]
MAVLLRIRHFGAFGVYHSDGQGIPLGAKHQALLALLSTAEGGIRTRAFLENTLWCLSQPEQAKASLRTALSTLKRHLGVEASDVLTANRERVTLRMDLVEIDEDAAKGEFMEGFELAHEEEFAAWLVKMRQHRGGVPVRAIERLNSASHLVKMGSDAILPTVTVMPLRLREMAEVSSPLPDVLGEELTRALGRSRAFCVTSFLAARQFDAVTSTPAVVSAATGATFIVSGSVSISEGQFTLDLDLNDAVRDKLIWSRRYEGDIADLLKGSTDLLHRMSRDVSRSMTGEALEQSSIKPLADLENHTLLMASIALMQNGQRALFERARDVLSVLADREYGHPIVQCWQGIWHVLRVEHGISENRDADIDAARVYADGALASEPMLSLAHTLNAMIDAQLAFNFEAALASLSLALEDNPSEALALVMKAQVFAYLDQSADAVQLATAARQLMPLGPQKFYFEVISAIAHLADGNFAKAVEFGELALASNPGFPQTLRLLGVVNRAQRNGSSGRDAIQALLAEVPGFAMRPSLRFVDAKVGAVYATGTR